MTLDELKTMIKENFHLEITITDQSYNNGGPALGFKVELSVDGEVILEASDSHRIPEDNNNYF